MDKGGLDALMEPKLGSELGDLYLSEVLNASTECDLFLHDRPLKEKKKLIMHALFCVIPGKKGFECWRKIHLSDLSRISCLRYGCEKHQPLNTIEYLFSYSEPLFLPYILRSSFPEISIWVENESPCCWSRAIISDPETADLYGSR